MLDRFRLAFGTHFEDVVGRPILVALSGGSDSVALLCLLDAALPSLGCRPFAAHVHHHLRGQEADADAAYCAELCDALGVPLAVEHLDPAPPRGTSPEAWWRGERYRLLEAVRERLGCAAIATAHTLDDQAETVLLKLLRGSGPRGTAAIRRRRGTVVRPLLDLGREELREWLRTHAVVWREDASNLAADRPRAWLRRNVVPLLETAYPRVRYQLAAFAAALAEDEEYLGASLATAAWPAVGRPIAVAAVAALAPALRRRWLLALADRLPLAEPPSRLQLAAVEGLLRAGRPAAVDLGRHWVLRRRGDRLHLSPPPCRPFAATVAAVPSTVALPGGFVGRLGDVATLGSRYRERLSARVLGVQLHWRSAPAGERWPAPGGHRLLRGLAAAGVPAEWRRAWPVLEADGTMIWVPGVGVRAGWGGDDGPTVGVELEVPW